MTTWDVEWLRKPFRLSGGDEIHVTAGDTPLHQTVASDKDCVLNIGNHYEVGILWIAKVFPEMFAVMVSQRMKGGQHEENSA